MHNFLWPMIRWQDDFEPERFGLSDTNIKPHFFKHPSEVPDQLWSECDAIIGPPVPAPYMEKLTRCKIYVKPAVGFDEIDLQAWASLGI
ncbi:MAG: hypothetical protein ACPH3H_08870, partial [Pseudomonadales bacterium]